MNNTPITLRVKFKKVGQLQYIYTLLKELIEANLVFLAMGFTGVPTTSPIVAQLGLQQTPRTALIPDAAKNIYCVGDCANGASLVVRALASGKKLPL